MKNLSIITGLPRSRTAWLSQFFTQHGHSYAYHECPKAFLRSPTFAEEWLMKMTSRQEQHVIDCNPGFMSSAIRRAFYQALNGAHFNLIVYSATEKEKDQCFRSYCTSFGPMLGSRLSKMWEQTLDGYDECLKLATRIFPMERNMEKSQLTEVASIVAPGFNFDDEHYCELRNLIITQKHD